MPDRSVSPPPPQEIVSTPDQEQAGVPDADLPASTARSMPFDPGCDGDVSVAELIERMKSTEPERWRAYRTDGKTYWIEPDLPWTGGPPRRDATGKMIPRPEAFPEAFDHGSGTYTRESLTERAKGLEALRTSMTNNGYDRSRPVSLGVTLYTIIESNGEKTEAPNLKNPTAIMDGWSRIVIAHELGIETIPYKAVITGARAALYRSDHAHKIPEGM